MLKQTLLIIIGIIVAPISWILQKLGITKPPQILSGPFEILNTHLFNQGIVALGEMHPQTVNNANEIAVFRLGFDPTKFYVVTITLSENENTAALVEADARQAPQYTGVCRNGPFVMACTFSPANADLEHKFQEAFLSYNHGD